MSAGTAAPRGAAGMEHPWVPAPPRCLCTARAAKQRRKGDRIVIDCQEQAYWLVNRPPVSAGRGGGLDRAQGVPPAPRMMLSLQPGAPNVLEQGPERRNCHTTRVQLVSGGVQAPPGLPEGTGHSQCLSWAVELPWWVPIHLTPGCAHILG